MALQFRRRKYRLGIARRGLFRRTEMPVGPALTPDEEEEWVVRLPRRRALLSSSEHAEPDSFRPDPILPSSEGELSVGSRRRLL